MRPAPGSARRPRPRPIPAESGIWGGGGGRRGRGRVSSRTPSLSFSARVLLRTAFDGRHCAQVVTTGVSFLGGRGPLRPTFSASRGSVELPAGDTDRAPRHSGPRRASGWRPSASSRPACLSRSRRPRGMDPGTLGGWTDCDGGGQDRALHVCPAVQGHGPASQRPDAVPQLPWKLTFSSWRLATGQTATWCRKDRSSVNARLPVLPAAETRGPHQLRLHDSLSLVP